MELLDIYNEEGKITGKIVPRGTKKEDFNEGEHVGIVQIYIENDKGEFLIEKSSKREKYIYLPVGGHITSGETPLEAIIRETKEEINYDLNKDELHYLGYFILDFPIRFIYYLKKNIDLNSLKLQEEEVEEVSYMKVEEMMDLIEKGVMNTTHKELIQKVLNYSNELK